MKPQNASLSTLPFSDTTTSTETSTDRFTGSSSFIKVIESKVLKEEPGLLLFVFSGSLKQSRKSLEQDFNAAASHALQPALD